MKKLLSIVDSSAEKRTLTENIDECGMGPMGSSSMSTTPVTMSVNLNAQGVDNIKELLNLMRSAESGMEHGHDHGMPMPAVGLDMPIKVTKIGGDDDMKPAGGDGDRGMDQIKDLVRKAGIEKEYSNSPEEAYAGVDSVTTDAGGGVNGPKDPADIRVKDPQGYENAEEAYANEPDEQYSDHTTMIKDLSGGLNREKNMYARAQPGDNAMAVRESSIRKQLDALYKEIKEGRTDEWQVNLRQPYGPEFNRGFGADISQSDEVKKIVAMMKPEDYIEVNKFLKDYPKPEDYRERNRWQDVWRGKEHQDMYNFVQKYNRDNNNLSVAQWLEKAKNKISSAVTGSPEKKVSYRAHRFDPDAYGYQEKHKDEVEPPQSVGVSPLMKNYKNMTQR